MENILYDGKFSDNILVVGQTGCGKTTFVENLGRNKMFGEIKRSTSYQRYSFQTKERTN